MQGIAFLVPLVGVVAACAALGVSRASYYRAQQPKPEPKPRPRPARALSDEERAHVLATLDDNAFMDKAPAQVFPVGGLEKLRKSAPGTEPHWPGAALY